MVKGLMPLFPILQHSSNSIETLKNLRQSEYYLFIGHRSENKYPVDIIYFSRYIISKKLLNMNI